MMIKDCCLSELEDARKVYMQKHEEEGKMLMDGLIKQEKAKKEKKRDKKY